MDKLLDVKQKGESFIYAGKQPVNLLSQPLYRTPYGA